MLLQATGTVTVSIIHVVLTNEQTTFFCALGWGCCWQLDCLRASGWTGSIQSGSARCPAAASDKRVQTPHSQWPEGPPYTAARLPLWEVQHLAKANKMVS